MRINYNATAMVAVNALNKNDAALSESTTKLSSGFKINRAKDNPSGYALSRKMKAQIEGLMQAKDNSSDGINIIETIDGTLSEVEDMVQRLNELAIKSSNGSNSEGDRELIDEEVQKLKAEIQRVSETTQFNGQTLLDGTFDLKGYTNNINVKVLNYSERIDTGKYALQVDGLKELYQFFEDTKEVDVFVDEVEETDENGGTILKSRYLYMKDNEEFTYNVDGEDLEYEKAKSALLSKVTVTDKSTDGDGRLPLPADVRVSEVNGDIVTLIGANGFELNLEINDTYAENPEEVEVDLTGIGAMTLQVGANEGQTLDVQIPSVGVKSLGIMDINVLTKRGCLEAIEAVDAAISKLSAIRGKLGADQNRLEAVVSALEVNHENMTGAYSGIIDTDMSEEYTNYSTYQVLSQASTSVLAQANERPSQVLQLLQ